MWAHAIIHKHTMHTGITGKPWLNRDIHIMKANMMGGVSLTQSCFTILSVFQIFLKTEKNSPEVGTDKLLSEACKLITFFFKGT